MHFELTCWNFWVNTMAWSQFHSSYSRFKFQSYMDYQSFSTCISCMYLSSLWFEQQMYIRITMVMCVHKWQQITPLLLCRCESFNSVMRIHNIYANRAAPSRDIAHSFAVMEHLRFICGGGTTDVAQRFGPHFLTIYFCMIVTVHWECRESWQQIISRFHIHLTQDSWTRPQGDV